MAYKVLDIYKDLPRTNCGDCGKGGCFAFASAVYLEGFAPRGCPHLTPEQVETMERRLAEGRERGEGRRPESSEQALSFLRGQIADADFAELAGRCGARHLEGPPEGLEIPFLGSPHRLGREDVTAPGGEAPTVWVKIFVLIYATRASGAAAVGEWASFRELPNTVSKAKSFEAVASRLAEVFEGRVDDLDRAAARLGGEPVAHGSASRALRFQALPRVPLLLLFWDREEEFSARATLLVDRGVLEYLDQEALVFLAEALAARLLDRDLSEVIP